VVEEKPVEMLEERPLDDGFPSVLKTRRAAGLAQRPSAIAATAASPSNPSRRS